MRSFIPPIHFRREACGQGRAEKLDRAAAGAGDGAARRDRARRAAHRRAFECAGATRAALARRLGPAQGAVIRCCASCSLPSTISATVLASPIAPAGGRHAVHSLCAAERIAARTRVRAIPRPVLPHQDHQACRAVRSRRADRRRRARHLAGGAIRARPERRDRESPGRRRRHRHEVRRLRRS